MKKIISLLMVLVIFMSCAGLSVSAVKISPEIDDVITDVEVEDSNGQKVSIALIRLEKITDELKPQSKDEKVIAQYTLKVKGQPKYPITFTAKVAGIKKNSKIYLLAKDEEGIQYIEATVIEDGKIKFTLDKYYSLLSLIGKVKSSTQIGTSDKTGDYMLSFVMVALIVSASVVLVSKKRVFEK